MYKLQPISLTVESENSYRVRFQTEGGQIAEYTFGIDNSNGFDLLVSEIEFLEITNGDPAADRLRRAIGNFHQARHFEYADEPNNATADMRGSQADTDARKRASASSSVVAEIAATYNPLDE